MSYHHTSTTFSLPVDAINELLRNKPELNSVVTSLSNSAYEKQKNIDCEANAIDQSLFLHGCSRSYWFPKVIDNISRNDVPGLWFLSANAEHPSQVRIDDSDGEYNLICILDEAAIDEAIAGIEKIFLLAKQSPIELTRQMPGYEEMGDWSPSYRKEMMSYLRDLILDAVTDQVISIHPSVYVPGADEGETPDYFFSYLRTLLVILRHAKLHGKRVIHMQYSS